MEILKVEHLSKTYGTGEAKVEALKDACFSLQKGEFAAVVGESGSGKSTLFKLCGRTGYAYSREGPAGRAGSVRYEGK